MNAGLLGEMRALYPLCYAATLSLSSFLFTVFRPPLLRLHRLQRQRVVARPERQLGHVRVVVELLDHRTLAPTLPGWSLFDFEAAGVRNLAKLICA